MTSRTEFPGLFFSNFWMSPMKESTQFIEIESIVPCRLWIGHAGNIDRRVAHGGEDNDDVKGLMIVKLVKAG